MLCDAVGEVDPGALKRHHVQRWLDSIVHLAPATRRTRFSIVRGFCKWPSHPRGVWVCRRVTKLAYAAGIKARPHDGVSAHALRHTAATGMYVRSGTLWQCATRSDTSRSLPPRPKFAVSTSRHSGRPWKAVPTTVEGDLDHRGG
jgi:hypothetical protein